MFNVACKAAVKVVRVKLLKTEVEWWVLEALVGQTGMSMMYLHPASLLPPAVLVQATRSQRATQEST
jgi:hypothetical protein